MKLPSIKTQLIIYLSALAIFLSIKEENAAFLLSVSVCAFSAIAADSIISYLKTKKFIITESSAITGLITGFVLSSDSPLWVFFAASLVAITSKHVIRIKNKHIFNPAAFGIFFATIFLGANTQWEGTYLWYIIIPAGLYFIYKIRKLEVLAGYTLAAFGLFGTQAFIQSANLLEIFGYLSYFYIFVMVIEPKTSPVKTTGKFIFGIAVASLIFILIEAGADFDVELCALLALNMFVPLLNKIPRKEA